ncbi:MAG: tripartite tricarboxylate transporter substrate binding protein [Pseudorhodoplanes sp.]
MTRLAPAFLCVALAASISTANAQTYPDKPIRVIVSIAAGSVTDVIIRAASKDLEAKLGQPLVIENRGGAAGILGGQACAQSAPDGYTLCVIYHSTMSYNPVQFDKLPYNADTDFTPITRLFLLTEGLFVNAELPAKNVAELKALAQGKPDAMNFATLGDASFPDLFRVWLNNQWGTKIVGVPYKGGGPAAQALAADEVQMTRFGVGNFRGVMDAGKVRALAISADQRSKLMPEVPTFKEAGLDYPGQGWWGLAAPRGTPAPIVDKVHAAFAAVFNDPKFVAYLEQQSVVSAITTPVEFAEFLKRDRQAAEALVKVANTPKTEYKPQ